MFLTGAASVGAFSTLASLSHAVLPLTLVALKSLIYPILAQQLTIACGGDKSDSDFSFVYGVLPTANVVFVRMPESNNVSRLVRDSPLLLLPTSLATHSRQ